MQRTLITLCGLCVAASAWAQEERSAVAFETGTIQVTGPRGGGSGSTFFNIQGLGVEERFRSYGTARWDLSSIRAEFDSLFPAGWQVTSVALELTQDNAAFSADGFVDVYVSTDDTSDAKTALSDLQYPFFDPNTGVPDLALASDSPILSYLFFQISSGTIDRYDQFGGPGGAGEALRLTDELASDIENDDILTLVFVDASDSVSATYAGQDGRLGREGPKLFITVEGGGFGCRADIDGDGSLTIFDFLAFQNLFAAGDLRADFDGDGQLTIFDFLQFQNEFAAGC